MAAFLTVKDVTMQFGGLKALSNVNFEINTGSRQTFDNVLAAGGATRAAYLISACDGGGADGPLRVFELLHGAKPVLINLGEPDGLDITPWADRVQLIDASYKGEWELPVLGVVSAPTAVLIRPDGYVAWVGDGTHLGLPDALATWFGPPTAA